MKKLTKYLLVSVLAFCCVLGLTACGEGNELKTYTEGRFALVNYDLYKNGQSVGTGNDTVHNNNVGSMDQYFIDLDNDGNMTVVYIELTYNTLSGGSSAEKYNLDKSDEEDYNYYINSKNKIVIKRGNATVLWDITINESKTVITMKSPMQTGNAQIVSGYEIGG